jgi:uncharacterized surface protein with fasciclin (FAS1) repeats
MIRFFFLLLFEKEDRDPLEPTKIKGTLNLGNNKIRDSSISTGSIANKNSVIFWIDKAISNKQPIYS